MKANNLCLKNLADVKERDFQKALADGCGFVKRFTEAEQKWKSVDKLNKDIEKENLVLSGNYKELKRFVAFSLG